MLRPFAVAAIPVVAACCAFTTVGVAYVYTMSDPSRFRAPGAEDRASDEPGVTDIAPGVFVPCISFLGVSGTACTVYKVGFGVTALLMALSIRLAFGYVGPELMHPGSGVKAEELEDCIRKGYTAALGVGMQGVFTLTEHIGTSCYIHWAGAAVFAGGAQSHATLALELYDRVLAKGQDTPLASASCRKALAWRKACLAAPQSLPFAMPAAFMMTLASQAFRSAEDAATVKKSGLNGAALQNGMGLMQWLIVLAFVLYFVSYCVDIYCCATQQQQQQQQQQQNKKAVVADAAAKKRD